MKNDKSLPVYGVGPIYGIFVFLITAAGIVLYCTALLKSGEAENSAIKVIFIVSGALLIAAGVAMWITAVPVNRIDQSIKSNSLKTTGVYGIVRNPIYSAIMFACTGALLCCSNYWLLIAPVIFYVFLTVLMILPKKSGWNRLSERNISPIANASIAAYRFSREESKRNDVRSAAYTATYKKILSCFGKGQYFC